jgi:hypothetical protein
MSKDQIDFRRGKAPVSTGRPRDESKDRDVERRMRIAGMKAAAARNKKPISLAGPKLVDED